MASASIATFLATELSRLSESTVELEGVAAVWVFRSSLRTHPGVDTDVDLLVVWDHRLVTALEAAAIRPRLSRSLGERIARRIDITLLSEDEAASSRFAREEGAVCVYSARGAND